MKGREFLGQHDLLVMLAVLRLGREAYGVPIAAEISAKTGREMLLGSIYDTLGRLERKRLVISRLGEATAKRGGRAKTYFKLTSEGLRQLRETQRGISALTEGLPELQGVRL
jgi:PadR family transcriptional regulator, regulatory protein PadR